MLNTSWVRKSVVRRSAGRQRARPRPRRRRPSTLGRDPEGRRAPRRASSASVASEVREPDVVVVDEPQVHARGPGGGHDLGGPAGHAGEHGVEERVVHDLDAPGARARRPAAACLVRARRGDRAQPVRAVVDGVHRRHHGQQHLGGADVGGRLVAADVLLAGLQREPVRRTPGRRRPRRRPAGRAGAARGPARTDMKPACGPP